MQTNSNIKPTSKFEIEEHANKKCDVLFYCNIEESEDGVYTYDFYRLSMRNRDNLKECIEADYEKWLEFTKNQEENKLAEEIRAKRDLLLTNTDWTQCQDTALTENEVENYRVYRQKLRDITKQSGFPYNVKFPKKP